MPLGEYHKLNGRLAWSPLGVTLFVGEGYWSLDLSGRQHRWAMKNMLQHVTVDGFRNGFNALSVRTIARTLPQYEIGVDEDGEPCARARLGDLMIPRPRQS